AIEEALKDDPQYQEGESGDHIVDLKEDLTRLGFANWSSPTPYYGSITAGVVKDFQEYYDLEVTGIADEMTRSRISEVLAPPYRTGDRGAPVVELKEKLTELGFANWSNPSPFYGNVTAGVVEDFQAAHGLIVDGIAGKNTLAVLDQAIQQMSTEKYDLTLYEALDIQMKANPQTDQNYAYVSKDYVENGKVTANTLNVRTGPGINYDKIGTLPNGRNVNILDEVDEWYVIAHNNDNRQWVTAIPNDLTHYLDPSNFKDDYNQRFQFLDLRYFTGISSSELSVLLEGKGKLDGTEIIFRDAAKKAQINEIYLISHAILETGHGGSALSKGVQYNDKTVYNFFGIGATDDCPVECGAKKAYDEGWFSVKDAIIGGAEYAKNKYIYAGQNTLYAMRWNPLSMDVNGYASHQYATDIGWASKQVSNYTQFYSKGNYDLRFLIPEYK
ncbi:Beta-N-acetylglucosaminidase, partial [Lentibacillus halodurans]